MVTAEIVRTFLVVDMAGLSLLALVYLRQRRMSTASLCLWGLLAVFVPVLGPFLVIANRPGEWDSEFSFKKDFFRLAAYFQRLLPRQQPAQMTRLERARMRRALRQRK